jgi:hypothetical protein
MQKYGCSERSVQYFAELTQPPRLHPPTSSPQSAIVDDNEQSPAFSSHAEQRDPDFDPIIHEQLNPSDLTSDSESDKLMIDQDSSDDERPILDDALGTMSNASDNHNNIDNDEDFIFKGLIVLFWWLVYSVTTICRSTLW